ncbi:hypothetical protein [Rhodovarius sp.]|uniref:hypothetical protein n=1 Tax=Rhodovarius sp. TaxID=2972673 RepID=UPI0034A4C496
MRKPVTKRPAPAKAKVPAPAARAAAPKRAAKFLPALPVAKVALAKPKTKVPAPTTRAAPPKRAAKAKAAFPAKEIPPAMPAEAAALPEPKPGISVTAKPSEKGGKAVSKGRSEPLNFRVTADFRRAFKRAAAAQDCKKVELLELIFNEWTARNPA